jgi:hypothetical protein
VSKHSPGPWKWTRETVGRHVWRLLDAEGRAVFWPVPDPRASAPGGMQSTDINCPNKDNASLIAAAPEMLKLLREVYEFGEDLSLHASIEALLKRIEEGT